MKINILCFALTYLFLFLDHFYRIVGDKILSDIFKGITSFVFVLFAFYSYNKATRKSEKFRKFSVFILTGICVSLLADILLEINFEIGFCIFVSVQIFYFYAFTHYGKLNLRFYIFAIVIAILVDTGNYLCPYFYFRDLQISVFVYTIASACVVSKSIESFRWDSVQAKTMPIGIILFAISDFLLQFRVFPSEELPEQVGSIIFIVSNTLYYTAQLLIGYSLSKDYFPKEIKN